MNIIRFLSQDPTDDVMKVLGCLRRMNFALHDLTVTPGGGGRFRVRLEYEPDGILSADTFVARVATFHGIESVAASVVGREEATLVAAPACGMAATARGAARGG
ncbi:hypothetical protein [Acuticoccus sediminis]|uniref:hypothetical protein n=1 Tax=Acuticoccus sediminis TaxID=2184697 RepID=UPI001CFE18D6|nr:hypothetical protein [Acuticoccus sediminis]